MAEIIEEKPVAKKAPAKKTAKKAAKKEIGPDVALITAILKARNAGILVKASIAWTDRNGNVREWSC